MATIRSKGINQRFDYHTEDIVWLCSIVIALVIDALLLPNVCSEGPERFEYRGRVVSAEKNVKRVDKDTHRLLMFDHYVVYVNDAGEQMEYVTDDDDDYQIVDGFLYTNRFVIEREDAFFTGVLITGFIIFFVWLFSMICDEGPASLVRLVETMSENIKLHRTKLEEKRKQRLKDKINLKNTDNDKIQIV